MRLNIAELTGELVTRELREEELGKLQESRGTQPKPLKRIGERHHALAKLIASGMKQGDAAKLIRYDQSRVSVLMGDPAFQELVAFYRKAAQDEYIDMHQRMADLSVDALVELQQRLEDNPDEISTAMLMEIITKTADRTGYGPATTNTQVNVNVNIAARLEAARKRLKVINGACEEVPEREVEDR